LSALAIRGLVAGLEGKTIVDGLDLEVGDGEVHALMGPNGHGKSTLANVLMGHPSYSVGGGSVLLDGEELLGLKPDERARKGLFLAFQYPAEIPGVTVAKFLKRASELRREPPASASAFIAELKAGMEELGIEASFANRYLNEGFSGGEKKRMEILQLLMLRPRFAIFDETDSGLDVDALKAVAAGIGKLRGPGFSALVITHYRRLLDHLSPDRVHILERGRITASGGFELVELLEREGYEGLRRRDSLGPVARAPVPAGEVAYGL